MKPARLAVFLVGMTLIGAGLAAVINITLDPPAWMTVLAVTTVVGLAAYLFVRVRICSWCHRGRHPHDVTTGRCIDPKCECEVAV